MPTRLTSYRIDVPGGTLVGDYFKGDHLNDNHPGKRDTLILLHGWTLDGRMWAPQFPLLGAHYDLIIPDRRGFGRSTAPPSLAEEVNDLLLICEQFNLDTVHVVGMSQAGIVAAKFASEHPKLVKSLILQGSNLAVLTDDKSPPEMPLGTYVDLVRSGRLDEMKALWREHDLMALSDPSQSGLVEAMLADYRADDLKYPPSDSLTLSEEEIRHVSQPVLSIVGDEDTPRRIEIAKSIAVRMKNAELKIVHGAGHMCNLCQADSYNSAVLSFLQGQDRAPLRPEFPARQFCAL